MNQEKLSNIVVDTRDLKSFCHKLSRFADNDTANDSFKFTQNHIVQNESIC